MWTTWTPSTSVNGLTSPIWTRTVDSGWLLNAIPASNSTFGRAWPVSSVSTFRSPVVLCSCGLSMTISSGVSRTTTATALSKSASTICFTVGLGSPVALIPEFHSSGFRSSARRRSKSASLSGVLRPWTTKTVLPRVGLFARGAFVGAVRRVLQDLFGGAAAEGASLAGSSGRCPLVAARRSASSSAVASLCSDTPFSRASTRTAISGGITASSAFLETKRLTCLRESPVLLSIAAFNA